MQDHAGPYVHIATFCRDVVEQADDAITLVGVTNLADVEADESGTRNAELTMFVSVRAGAASGKHLITIRPIGPSGDLVFPEGSFPALFEGGSSGVEIQVDVRFEAKEEGPYWFELLLDGTDLLTKIPLEIVFGPSASESEDRA
ncbi:MAG: hypothetical protein M3323_14080 [Actinomycetota bacterium]|nr:hypothetical protein [Actinomycetota bacterium]